MGPHAELEYGWCVTIKEWENRGVKYYAPVARAFIAYHTSIGQLSIDQDSVTLIGPDELAEHIVDLGLTSWIMAKVG